MSKSNNLSSYIWLLMIVDQRSVTFWLETNLHLQAKLSNVPMVFNLNEEKIVLEKMERNTVTLTQSSTANASVKLFHRQQPRFWMSPATRLRHTDRNYSQITSSRTLFFLPRSQFCLRTCSHSQTAVGEWRNHENHISIKWGWNFLSRPVTFHLSYLCLYDCINAKIVYFPYVNWMKRTDTTP